MDAGDLARAYGISSDDGTSGLENAGVSSHRRHRWVAKNYNPLPDGERLTVAKLLWAMAVRDAWVIAYSTGMKPHIPAMSLFEYKRRRRV